MVTAVLALTGLPSAYAAAPTSADIASRLREADCVMARARLAVSLPQNADDVTYSIDLEQTAAPGDTLCPVSYLIDWTYESSQTGDNRGFSAYFDGHAYRFGAERLQEYHMSWDSIPFQQGPRSVQLTPQFSWMLPAMIADKIETDAADPNYTLTVRERPGGQTELRAVREIGGVESNSAVYLFGADGLPLKISTESNPGSIAEQSMTVSYEYGRGDCQPLSEEVLAARYPDAFGRYRVSNFKIENLPGTALPAITLPTTTGERYMRHRGDPLRAATLVVLLDPRAGFARETVEAVRSAVDGLDVPTDVIWACTGTSADAAEEAVGLTRPGEHLLINASQLAADCGAASLPAIIMADMSGTVRDVVLGFNKDLDTVVIQKMSLIK